MKNILLIIIILLLLFDICLQLIFEFNYELQRLFFGNEGGELPRKERQQKSPFLMPRYWNNYDV